MATNTIAGVNLDRIANKSLDALTTELIPLKDMFITDFSNEVAKGPTVTTRYPTQPVVKALLTAANRTSDNSTLTARTVTIGDPRGIDIGFNDVEVINSEINLTNLFIRPGIVAVIEDIMATVFALITAAKFGNAAGDKLVVSAANFDADNMADLQEKLSVKKVPSNRHVVLSPSYFSSLVKDNAIQAQYASGLDTLVSGVVGRVHGIGVHSYNGTIPTNSENHVGFACGPQAICLAARQPVTPDTWYGQVVNVVEPVTGLPVQFRYFYDGAEHRLQMLTQHGAIEGNTGALVRILSA